MIECRKCGSPETEAGRSKGYGWCRFVCLSCGFIFYWRQGLGFAAPERQKRRNKAKAHSMD